MTTSSGRYRVAAQYYLRGRPPYAPALIRRVAQLCGLNPAHRVLDLGCGPGQLARAFAPLAGQVVAVDPEPAMLEIARQETARAGLSIDFREGSSVDLGPALGAFRLVVIGRAFHWMDREETLRRLDGLIEPGGALALFGDDHPAVPDNRWCKAFDRLIERYAEGDAAHTSRRAPHRLHHEGVLLDSPFCHLERHSVIERRRTPLDSFADRALSLSSVSHGQRAERADDVARDVVETMAPFAQDGLVTEVVESQALLAWRPPPS